MVFLRQNYHSICISSSLNACHMSRLIAAFSDFTDSKLAIRTNKNLLMLPCRVEHEIRPTLLCEPQIRHIGCQIR
jgi:hypothetical protein